MFPATLDLSSLSDKVWLTADPHFGHEAVRVKSGRPWANTDRMDNALLKNMNRVVGPSDLFIIAGDLTLFGKSKANYVEKIIERMPGIKILVLGNHDRFKPQWYIDRGFAMVTTSLVLPGGVLVIHDPSAAEVWPADRIVLHGHVHRLWRVLENVVNLAVDLHDFSPLPLNYALELAGDGPREPRDWKTLSEKRHEEG